MIPIQDSNSANSGGSGGNGGSGSSGDTDGGDVINLAIGNSTIINSGTSK